MIPARDLTLLWGRAAARCSFPACRKELPADDRPARLNQTAHIISGKRGGPRYDPTYSRSEIDRYPNLIVLCTEHHTIVDANSGANYPAKELRDMKLAHEGWVKNALALGEPWQANIGQLEYVNVPRLAMIAGVSGHTGVIADIDGNLCDLGGRLARLLHDLRVTVNELTLRAIPLSTTTVEELQPGMVLSFAQAFRTKNMPGPAELDTFRLRGDDDRDPHIYVKHKGAKVLLPLNPRWVGTSTAFSDFRRGVCWVTGLAQVKHVTVDLVVATPLVVGIPPDGPWDLMGPARDNDAQEADIGLEPPY